MPTIAVLPAAKDDPFVLELLAAGIDCRPVPHEGDLRVNITITEPDGTTTKLNSPGPQATPPPARRARRRRCVRRAADADWIVLAGSLPPGAPPEWYAELVTALRAAGARVAVDTSDAPLKALVDALPDGRAPHLMKPNGEELALVHRHRRRRRSSPTRSRPPRRGARPGRPRGRARAGRRSAPTAPSWSTPTGAWHATPAADHRRQHRRRRRLQPLRLPPRGRHRTRPRRATRAGRGLRQRGRRTARHDHPPPPSRSAPTSSTSPASTSPLESDHDRPDHAPPSCGSTRISAADKHEVIRALAAHRRRRRALRPTPTSSPRTRSPARAPRATGLPGRHRDPPLPDHGRRRSRRSRSRGSRPKVEFGAKDGPADLAFLIAAPAGGDATHLQLLTKLARALVKHDFTDSLRSASTPRGGRRTWCSSVVGDAPAAACGAPPRPRPRRRRRRKSLVAVTACPTGIAHTYMAAEALEAAAARAGVPIAVETQGSAGAKPLPPETIAAASAVIFAVDVGVRDRGRFAGKPVVSSSVKRPIDDGDAMIAEALRYADDPNAPRVEGSRHRRREHRWRRRRDVGCPHPPRPDDRRLVHDPVRRGRRSADRPRLPVRRLRDRQPLRRDRGRQHDLQPPERPRPRARPRPGRHRLRPLGLLRLHRGAVLHHRQDRLRAVHPGLRRLRRLRDRRPAGHRARASSWVASPPTCST